MLELRNVTTAYDQIVALKAVSLEVKASEVTCLLGANGAGKSTLINTISGLLKPKSGELSFEGRAITGMRASRIAGLGIVQVPEGRGIFQQMTVHENLLMGAHLRKDSAGVQRDVERHFERFPRLAERRNQKAGVMSGGEQQMLAIARALMAQPRLLLLDEPSMGLAPLMVEDVFRAVREIAAEDVTILLVEQNARLALEISDRAYVLQNGEIALSGSARELMESDTIKDAYLGAA
ncbi:ATP-binding cassette domain-containing protein [Aquicoccus sp. SCR17]|nr:ATP-binding cassette domain-containing protein [Carideicomes alvinocaridis]